MPRGPRLDAPGVLHHVTIPGLKRRVIFRDARDRRLFLDYLQAVVESTGLCVLAWALMPNHAHLLVRTPQPRAGTRGGLATAMHRLPTRYAVAFNRRHHRSGHLFQNRYKSVVVEEDPYLLELVRYIHLNPLRAGLVRDLAGLDAYPWSGHSALMHRRPRSWQAGHDVLGLFGQRVVDARRRYRAFVAAGVARGRRPDLQGGGLRRSVGGLVGVASLRRGRERWAADERILGSGAFVDTLRAEAARHQQLWPAARAAAAFQPLIHQVATLWNLPPTSLAGGARRRPIPAARAAVCTLAVTYLGLPGTTVARALGVSPSAVAQAVARGHSILAARKVDAQALLRSLKRELS